VVRAFGVIYEVIGAALGRSLVIQEGGEDQVHAGQNG
jgi:hypothetical protein